MIPSHIKGNLESSRIKKLKRRKIYKNAFRSGGRPMTLEEVEAIQVNRILEIETFYDNVGSIFPLILEMIQSGLSISKIEKRLGFKDRSLENSLQTYTRLNDAINEVRKLKSDSHAR